MGFSASILSFTRTLIGCFVSSAACTKALDVGIILDGSGSVGSSNFKTAKEFVQSLIAHFAVSPKATRFGVITYSTNPNLEFDLAKAKYHDIVELKRRVMEISYPGQWTRTDKALEMAAGKLFTEAGGDRKDKPNILVVFTDGKTNSGSKPYPEVLRPLQVSVLQFNSPKRNSILIISYVVMFAHKSV